MHLHTPHYSYLLFLLLVACLNIQGLTQTSQALTPPTAILTDNSNSISIEELLVYDQETDLLLNQTRQFREEASITLPASYTYLELYLATPSPDDKVAYYVDGMDHEWQLLSSQRLRLYKLPPGTYQLQLGRVRADGQIDSQSIYIPISVQSARSLLSWLILGSLALALVGTIAYGVRYFYLQKRVHHLEQTRRKITTQRSTELSKLNDSKSNMFIDLVHEIRSPLALVMALNESIKLERFGSTNHNIKGASRIALRNGNQLVKLTDEILELSKLEQIEVPLEESAVHFHSFMQGLYSMIQPRAILKRIEMKLDYQLCENLQVLVDIPKFEKIFNNLVGNAVKFTPEEGHVSITVHESHEGFINLMVEDSGPGIPEKELTHIFERYYQSEYKELFGGYGTGIGLALAKKYADLFEGQLNVVSEVGHGTLFAFSFPKKEVAGDQLMPSPQLLPNHPELNLAEEMEQPMLQQPTSILKNPAKPASSAHVLVVEDNPDMRHFLQELLAPHYQVLTAEDGQAALDLLERPNTRIDLIVSDVIMPRVDGFQLLTAIRAHDKWRGLPFLMLTAEVRTSKRIDAFTFGVDDYLIKPFSTDELLVRIKSVLHNSSQRQGWNQKQSVPQPEKAPAETESQSAARMTAAELEWLKKLEEIVQQEISNRQFNILELASVMAVSERQLFRQIKRLTGMTPNKYLRDIKLYKAKELLEDYTYGTISEVSYAVGFEDPYYFSKIYTARFGKKPAEYMARYTAAGS